MAELIQGQGSGDGIPRGRLQALAGGRCRSERGHATPCTQCSEPLDPRARVWRSIESDMIFCGTECWALWLGVMP